MRPRVLTIRRLRAGGLNLGYRCSSRCRHCLYACGPHRRDGLGDGDALDATLDEIAARAPLASFHIGGGEPFLDTDLLARTLDGFRSRSLILEYVETNAFWARSDDRIREVLSDLRPHGLRGLLVSASHFHAESVPPSRTLSLIRVAHGMLDGLIVWLPDFVRDLAALPPDEKLDLDALVAERGDRFALETGMRYGIIPGGRGGRFLATHGFRRPWQDFSSHDCRTRLENTTHFHVDLDGNYVPGLCGGIVIPFSLVPGDVPLSRFPVLDSLVSGVGRLTEMAISEHGFEPDPVGYSGPCDLCTHVRLFLSSKGGYEELGPPGFYEERSLSGYP